MFVSSSAEYVFRDRPKLLISAAVRPVQSRITFSCALRSPCRAARIVGSEMLTDLKENSFLIKLIFKFIYLCCCGPLLGCAVGESTKNYAKIPDLSSLSGQLGKKQKYSRIWLRIGVMRRITSVSDTDWQAIQFLPECQCGATACN